MTGLEVVISVSATILVSAALLAGAALVFSVCAVLAFFAFRILTAYTDRIVQRLADIHTLNGVKAEFHRQRQEREK